MPFMIQVGPPQISIHQGQTVLISDEKKKKCRSQDPI
jgi:hypothetical protein